MVTTREQGEITEKLACQFLEDKGLKLQERNYHCRFGEIDLIMQDNDALVFIEVRYRRNINFGSGAESVTTNKQSKLLKTASAYLQQHDKLARHPVRFDVVSMTGTIGATSSDTKMSIDWIKNAFGA